MEDNKYNYLMEEEDTIDIKEILLKYIFHWKYFLLSTVICLGLGFTYLRFHPPLYEVSATILIKDDKDGGSIGDELSAFADMGLMGGKGNIDNEIEILKSRSLMTKVVNELKLNVSYFSKGRPIEHERYFDTPIYATYKVLDSTQTIEKNWILTPENNKQFALNDAEGLLIGNFKFGEQITTDFGNVSFNITAFFSKSYINNNFRVVIRLFRAVISR